MNASSSTSSFERRSERETVETPGRFWKFPIAALAALALVIAFEAGVWKYRYRLWDGHQVLSEKKRKVLLAAAEPDTIAIFGVSRFYHLRPDEIANTLGTDIQVTNYSWRWCGIEAYEAMLRGLIQARRVPKLILVDGIPEILGYKPYLVNARDNEIFQIGLAQTAPRLALLRTIVGLKEWKWFWNTITYTATPPSTLYRESVSSGLHRLIREGTLPPLPENYETVVETWEQKGWLVFAAGKRGTDKEYRQLEQLTGPYKLYDNLLTLRAYERFLRLAERHGTRVILLPVPSNPLIYDAYKREGVFDAYDQWLNTLEKKHTNFQAPAPRWLNWPEAMGDAGHVHEEGAERHMRLILEMLNELDIKEL